MPGQSARSGWVRVTPSIVSVRAFGALAVTMALLGRVAAAGLADWRLGGTAMTGPLRFAEPA